MEEKKTLDGLLEQIMSDLEVKEPAELTKMKAEGDRIVAEAMAQKRPLFIIHRRIGNREKLEAFLRFAHDIRQLPAIRRNVLQTKITEDFVGELELRIMDNSPAEAETAFCKAFEAHTPFFDDPVVTDEDGCRIIRAAAELFEVVAHSEPF